MSHLIDTTEMYLRTVYELLEEGIAPLRARIAERLHHSGPTVSETVARMERDGLLTVGPDRQLHLSEQWMRLAVGVMRRHRLAERLLTDVIGLDWHLVHDEACRWEHVMSDVVEERLVTLLDSPESSPYGNPIPDSLDGAQQAVDRFRRGTVPLSEAGAEGEAVLERISEHLQQDPDALAHMHRVGAVPGATVRFVRGDSLTLTTATGEVVLDGLLADRLAGAVTPTWCGPTSWRSRRSACSTSTPRTSARSPPRSPRRGTATWSRRPSRPSPAIPHAGRWGRWPVCTP